MTRRLGQAGAFAAIATLAYTLFTWRHQPILLSREAPRPLVIEGWMIAALAIAAFATFFCAWLPLAALVKRRRPLLAGLTGAVAASFVPVPQFWIFAAVGTSLFAARTAQQQPDPSALAAALALAGLVLGTGIWYLTSLLAIGWFTIPMSAGLAVFVHLYVAGRGRRSPGTLERSGPPGPP